MRLADVTLKELDDGGREGEVGRALQDVLLVQVVLDHELGKIADDFGAWSHLVKNSEKKI